MVIHAVTNKSPERNARRFLRLRATFQRVTQVLWSQFADTSFCFTGPWNFKLILTLSPLQIRKTTRNWPMEQSRPFPISSENANIKIDLFRNSKRSRKNWREQNGKLSACNLQVSKAIYCHQNTRHRQVEIWFTNEYLIYVILKRYYIFLQ